MPTELTVIRVLNKRPDDIPEDHLIFNAPRELAGYKYWQGDWHHGIFYVAVDPKDSYAENHIRVNIGLDGWLVEYISEKDIRIFIEDHAAAIGLHLPETPTPEQQEQWIQFYFEKEGRLIRDPEPWIRSLFQPSLLPS